MSQVLFINVFGYGHINPTIGLVKELIDRGEQVTYIAGEEFGEKLEGIGAMFVGYQNISSLQFQNGNIDLENSGPVLNEIVKMYVDITDIVFHLKRSFDYLIYDSLFSLGNEVARVLRIPAISSVTTFATNSKSNYSLGLVSTFKPVLQKMVSSPEFLRVMKYFKEKYGIETPDIFTAHKFKENLNIVYTSKYFQPMGETFDESYKFIGPVITERYETLDFSLKKEGEKLIYISLGTVYNNSVEFYESCFKAFRDMDTQIILSVGKNIDIHMFPSIPENFIVRNYVPQLEVLKQAELFITHGGMNSVNEALYHSVPLILIPYFFDQPAVADRVANLGAGIVLEKEKVTAELLRQSVNYILSESSFKINSNEIGKSLRAAGGYKKAVDEIFSFKVKEKQNSNKMIPIDNILYS